MGFKKICIAAFVALLFSQCSLFEVTVDTGVEALSKKDLNTRIGVRAFYTEFTEGVTQTADSIFMLTSDKEIKRNAILWKINSSASATRAMFQTVAEVSLVDTWIYAMQMDAFLNSAKADTLFQDYAPLTQTVASEMLQNYEDFVHTVYGRNGYSKLEEFATQYSQEHPFTDLYFPRENILSDLATYLNIADTAYVQTVGSAPEVMSDMADRVTVYGNQLQVQLEWHKDLYTIDSNFDSLSNEAFERVDTLTVMIDEMVKFAQASPEVMNQLLDKLYSDWGPSMNNLNVAIENSIKEVSKEREAMERFVDEQRLLVVADVNSTGDALIKTTAESLSDFVRKISWVIILLIVVLAIVIVGVPVFIGFTLAKYKYKK